MNACLEDLLKKKVIFITGKGGVGKSTLAAAFSYYLAEQRGERVLVIDADPAHSLPDTLGIGKKVALGRTGFSCSNKLVRVYDDLPLDLLLLDPVTDRRDYNGIHRIMWLLEMGKEVGFYSNLKRASEFFTMADALSRLFQRYDKFVIDNEPSAGTLDILENLDGWIVGLEGVKRYRALFNIIFGTGLIDKEIAQEVKSLINEQNGFSIENYKRIVSAAKMALKEEKYVEPIIVSSPEEAVIRETHRLREELKDKMNVNSHYVVFNKAATGGSLLENNQSKMIKFREESLAKCLVVPQMEPEVINLESEEGAKNMHKFILESMRRL